jgi:hypothetical protein
MCQVPFGLSLSKPFDELRANGSIKFMPVQYGPKASAAEAAAARASPRHMLRRYCPPTSNSALVI